MPPGRYIAAGRKPLSPLGGIPIMPAVMGLTEGVRVGSPDASGVTRGGGGDVIPLIWACFGPATGGVGGAGWLVGGPGGPLTAGLAAGAGGAAPGGIVPAAALRYEGMLLGSWPEPVGHDGLSFLMSCAMRHPCVCHLG
jgi:hypothetical protein